MGKGLLREAVPRRAPLSRAAAQVCRGPFQAGTVNPSAGWADINGLFEWWAARAASTDARASSHSVLL